MPDDVYELTGEMFSAILDRCGEATPEDVISALQMLAARVGCAFEKEVGEVVASQQLLCHRVKTAMIAEGTYGCAVHGALSDMKN